MPIRVRSSGVKRASTLLLSRRGKPGLTLAVLGLAAMAFSVLQSLVIPVLPDIGRNLHVS